MKKNQHKIYSMNFAKVYPLYVNKVERKGRTVAELNTVITWLTGYTKTNLGKIITSEITFEEFFSNAPKLNENRNLITGSVCNVKLAEITDPLMKEIRYLDKLVDELAKGKKIEKILRTNN